MKLKEIGEFGFIRRVSRGCLVRPERVLRSIGDDAAAFRPGPNEIGLVTTDLLVERVHFLRNATTGFNLGYKSLAVNLSDIAAMGGIAREAFVSIAIPEDCPVEFLEDVYRGMRSLAARHDVNILGGDTTGSKVDLVINVAVYGSVEETRMLCRNTARAGDVVLVTGNLGDSRAGCHLIINDLPVEDDDRKHLFKAHILPEPHLEEGRFLAESGSVHAAIDVSDGLSSDLGHILTESGVGAFLDGAAIPVSGELRRFCESQGEDPVRYALAGGEDYVLIATAAPDHADDLSHRFEKYFQRPLTPIGKITSGDSFCVRFPDGREEIVKPAGWDHFKQ
jgi:thiamine-monophosphate kinase